MEIPVSVWLSISNVITESLDICPQLHLKQISQSSGVTLLIHTSRHMLDYMHSYKNNNNTLVLFYSA